MLIAQVITLWPDKPPQYLENAPAEITDESGTVRNGKAVIVCAGGGYGALDWLSELAQKAG